MGFWIEASVITRKFIGIKIAVSFRHYQKVSRDTPKLVTNSTKQELE